MASNERDIHFGSHERAKRQQKEGGAVPREQRRQQEQQARSGSGEEPGDKVGRVAQPEHPPTLDSLAGGMKREPLDESSGARQSPEQAVKGSKPEGWKSGTN